MPLIEAKQLSKHFQSGRQVIRAVCDVSLAIRRGETLGLVGESGCGKSTLGKLLLNLKKPDQGHVVFDGMPISDWDFRKIRPLRKRMQMIFQSAGHTFNPYFTVQKILAEPLDNYSQESATIKKQRMVEALEQVGLNAGYLTRFGHEMSGGQRQRVAIARALILKPDFVVCDEPVSSLDYALRYQILDLLQSLKCTLNLTYLFISHDIRVINAICDRVVVMYLGHIVEILPRLNDSARHPYTRALMAATLPTNPRQRKTLTPLFRQSTPSVSSTKGCVFYDRCLFAQDLCAQTAPVLKANQTDHFVACHFSDQLVPF